MSAVEHCSLDGHRLSDEDVLCGLALNGYVFEHIVGSGGTGDGQFFDPSAVRRAPDGHRLVVADTGNHRVQVYAKDGTYVRTLGGNGEGEGNNQLTTPEGVAVEPGEAGRVFVTDLGNHRVQVLNKPSAHA